MTKVWSEEAYPRREAYTSTSQDFPQTDITPKIQVQQFLYKTLSRL
jgi:hypothetical protein